LDFAAPKLQNKKEIREIRQHESLLRQQKWALTKRQLSSETAIEAEAECRSEA
jgi:hypothetical protein